MPLFRHTVQVTLDNLTSPNRRFIMYTSTPEDDEIGLITEASELVIGEIRDLTIITSTQINLPFIEESPDLFFEMLHEQDMEEEPWEVEPEEAYEVRSIETD